MRVNSEITNSMNFEDLLILPQITNKNPSDVSLKTKLTKNVSLNIPFVTAADETITKAEMAIAIARLGGVGILSSKLSIDEQIKEIEKIKAAEVLKEANSKSIVDYKGKILTIAAVKSHNGSVDGIKLLADAGLDIVLIENAALNIKDMTGLIEKIRVSIPELQIIGGNAYSSDDVRVLAESGAEGVKIGNRKQIVEQLGIDALNVNNILDIIGEAQVAQVPVMFDDNIINTSSIAKIIALGCSSVVIKDFLIGVHEAPGELTEEGGVSYKISNKAKHRYKGNLEQVLNPLINNLKFSIAHTGNADIRSFIDNTELSIVS